MTNKQPKPNIALGFTLIITTFLVLSSGSLLAQAQEPQKPTAEVQQLKDRLQQLEQTVEELKAQIHSIDEAKKPGAATDGHDYYEHWLAALEKLLSRKDVAGKGEVDELAAAWERAAHATPHGKPILLENDPGPR